MFAALVHSAQYVHCTLYSVHNYSMCPHIYIYTLLLCLSVCLYLINVKTAELVGPKKCFCYFYTYIVHREDAHCSQIDSQLKVVNDDRREAPKCILHLNLKVKIFYLSGRVLKVKGTFYRIHCPLFRDILIDILIRRATRGGGQGGQAPPSLIKGGHAPPLRSLAPPL